jgi:hypothetical protein
MLEITRAESSMVHHDPMVSRGERNAPNWLMPASNDTRVRVLNFQKSPHDFTNKRLEYFAVVLFTL